MAVDVHFHNADRYFLTVEAAKYDQQALLLKQQKEEEQKLEETKMIEFLKAKAEREQLLEAEEKLKKYERELEIARLLAMQEQALDQVCKSISFYFCNNWVFPM